MRLLQLIFRVGRWLSLPDRPPIVADDPLTYLDIAAMTERQRADLPFPRPMQKCSSKEALAPVRRCA